MWKSISQLLAFLFTVSDKYARHDERIARLERQFNELAKQVPEGIYVRSLVQTGPKLVLSGVAQSNARITTLMNNLDDSPLLERSTLIETKSEVVASRRLNAFSITTMITRQTTAVDKPAPAPGKK